MIGEEQGELFAGEIGSLHRGRTGEEDKTGDRRHHRHTGTAPETMPPLRVPAPGHMPEPTTLPATITHPVTP